MVDTLLRPSLWASVLVMSVLAFGAAGCGGNDDDGSSGSEAAVGTSDTDTGTTESEPSESSEEAAALPVVLSCLQGEGLDAKDQSSSTSGEVIGIDYSGGRTTISFEETQKDADLTASIAEGYGEVVQVGTAVASIDPSADTADTEVIESCLPA